jgi:hypothetical protein
MDGTLIDGRSLTVRLKSEKGQRSNRGGDDDRGRERHGKPTCCWGGRQDGWGWQAAHRLLGWQAGWVVMAGRMDRRIIAGCALHVCVRLMAVFVLQIVSPACSSFSSAQSVLTAMTGSSWDATPVMRPASVSVLLRRG